MQRKLHAWALALVLIASSLLSLYAMSIKENMHVDEVASYGFANSAHSPFITGYDDERYGRYAYLKNELLGDGIGDLFRNAANFLKDMRASGANVRDKYLSYLADATPVWKTGADFRSYLQVDPGEGFNYGQVLINSFFNDHPPLFELLLHTVCSFFPGRFSQYYGFAINLAFLLATTLVLYRLVKRHFGGAWRALCAAASFSLSLGALSAVIFQRDYMAFLFFIALSMSIHLEVLAPGAALSRRRAAGLAAVTALGFYTHYHYLFFAFALCVLSVWVFAARGDRRAAWRYLRAMIYAALISLVIWPASPVHLLLSYRAGEALSGALLAHFGKALFKNLRWLYLSLCAERIWAAALFLAGALAVLVRDRSRLRWAVALAPTAFFALAVTAIAPDFTRYIIPVFPALAILIGCGAVELLEAVMRRGGAPVALAAVVLISLLGDFTREIFYTFPGAGEQQAYLADSEGATCLYISPSSSFFYADMLDLTGFGDVLILAPGELSALEGDEKLAAADAILLYIGDTAHADALLAQVMSTAKYGGSRLLASPGYGSPAFVYRLSRS